MHIVGGDSDQNTLHKVTKLFRVVSLNRDDNLNSCFKVWCPRHNFWLCEKVLAAPWGWIYHRLQWSWCQSRDSPANHGEDHSRAGISMQPLERRSERVFTWASGCWPSLAQCRGAWSPWMRLKMTTNLSKEPSEAADGETWRTRKYIYFPLLCGTYILFFRAPMEECPSCISN